ncbi:hypothetical protein D3C72_1890720 [compost metagenome]
MVEAAQAAVGVVAQRQRCAAVRALLVEQAHLAVGVTEGHQVFAEQPHAHRLAAGLGDLRRQQRWDPEAPDQFAHGGAAANLGQHIVVFASEHRSSYP